jgi:hypothetical protein
MQPFHNRATADLADEYGALDAQIKALSEQRDALKDELKARQIERVEGVYWTVTLSASTRTTYDDKAIREALGADICKTYERVTETVTLRVKPTVMFQPCEASDPIIQQLTAAMREADARTGRAA